MYLWKLLTRNFHIFVGLKEKIFFMRYLVILYYLWSFEDPISFLPSLSYYHSCFGKWLWYEWKCGKMKSSQLSLLLSLSWLAYLFTFPSMLLSILISFPSSHGFDYDSMKRLSLVAFYLGNWTEPKWGEWKGEKAKKREENNDTLYTTP